MPQHYGGTEDLAATSYGVPVFGVIMAIAGLFGLGSSTLASRKLGEGQRDRPLIRTLRGEGYLFDVEVQR